MPRRSPSSTHAPPVPMNCSSCDRPRARAPSRFRGGLTRRRTSSGCNRSGAIADQPTVRDAFRMRRRAGDPHAGEHGGQRRGELARDRPRLLDEEEADRAQHGEREEAQPVEGHGHGGRVGEPAVQLQRPVPRGCWRRRVRARPSPSGPATPSRGESHPRGRHDRRPGARRGARARRGRGRRRPSGAPGRSRSSASQTVCRTSMAAGVEAEHVAQPVVLPLVELVGDERARSRPSRVIVRPKTPMRSGSLPLASASDRRRRRTCAVSSVGEQRPRARRAPARCPRRAARARRRRSAGASSTRSPARTASPNESGSWSSTTWVAPAAAALLARGSRRPARARRRARQAVRLRRGSRRGCAGDGRRRYERRGRR